MSNIMTQVIHKDNNQKTKTNTNQIKNNIKVGIERKNNDKTIIKRTNEKVILR